MANIKGKEIPNCWEFLNCPSEVRASCPAYPDYGRECWKTTGTRCEGGKLVKATLEEKILYCRNECEFYKTCLKELYP